MAFPERIYLDTNALPNKRGIRAGLMSPLVAIALRTGCSIVVPRLAVDEYFNMRLTTATSAVDALTKALREAVGHLDLPPTYIPSPEEAVEPLILELESFATFAETHPDDAQERQGGVAAGRRRRRSAG